MTNAADADFYHLEQLLDDAGRDALQRTREFMTKEVEPVINRYWTREEFPHELIPALRPARASPARPTPATAAPAAARCWTGCSRWSWPGPTRRSPRSSACTAAWRWARSTCAARRSRSSAGCRRWPGWRRSARSG